MTTADPTNPRRPKALPNLGRTWDTIWKRDEAGTLEEQGTSHLMDEVKFSYLSPLLPREGTIVEFGCGSARLLRFAAGRGLRAIGIDFSRRALEVARSADGRRRGATRLALLRADVSSVPLRSGSVDAVASTGLLEHFVDPVPVVREMVRILKPGGLFYSDIVPAKFSLFRSLDCLRLRHMEVFERGFSRREIQALLSEAGLQDTRVFGAGVFPPRIPFFERFSPIRRAVTKLVALTLPLWRALDGTSLATLAGFYFFAVGVKPAHWSPPGSTVSGR